MNGSAVPVTVPPLFKICGFLNPSDLIGKIAVTVPETGAYVSRGASRARPVPSVLV